MIDREKMKARLETLNNKGGSNVFFKPQEGSQVIRILPDSTGDPFRDYSLHYNIGSERSFLCPKRQEGKECAICNFAGQLWDEYKKTNDKSVLDMAKRYFAKQRFFSPIVVRGKEEEGVKWWSYSKTIYDKLLRLTLDVDYDDITDMENGTDLNLTYTSEGLQFPKIEFQPKRKPSSLCETFTEEQCVELLESIPDLDSEMIRKTSAEIKVILAEDIASKTTSDVSEKELELESSQTEKYGSQQSKKVDQMFNELLEEN